MTRNNTKAASRKRQTAPRAKSSRPVVVLVATRKGAWLIHGDVARKLSRCNQLREQSDTGSRLRILLLVDCSQRGLRST